MPRAADRAKAVTVGEMATRAHYEVMRAGREKVQRSAPLWRRVTDGNPCGFCAMVASRGPVYGSARAAGDGKRYHGRCGCTVEPYIGDPAGWQPSPEEARFLEAYRSVHRGGLSTDELSDLMDEWLAANPVDTRAATPSLFTSNGLRDALDPTRRRTVAAIRKELEGTAAGRDLTAAIKGFTETRGGVANLRKNIAAVMDGTASKGVTDRTRAFVDAMNTYPTGEVPTLYRGIAVRVESNTAEWWDAFESQFKPGEKMRLNASSFSSSEKKAAEFSQMVGGTRQASSNHTAVRIVLEDNPHALPVEQLSKFKSEKEWITGGDFEVVGYQPATKQQPYYRVVVRQIKTLGDS